MYFILHNLKKNVFNLKIKHQTISMSVRFHFPKKQLWSILTFLMSQKPGPLWRCQAKIQSWHLTAWKAIDELTCGHPGGSCSACRTKDGPHVKGSLCVTGRIRKDTQSRQYATLVGRNTYCHTDNGGGGGGRSLIDWCFYLETQQARCA